jgi:OmpA-OmpF porin, OOP family
MKLRSVLLAATAMAMPLAAHAQLSMPNLSGFYVGAGAGVNFILPQENVNSFAAAPGVPFVNTNSTIKSNPGPVAYGALGYLLPYGLAVELEGDYRSNGWYGIKNTRIPLGASGTEKKYGPMVNLRYDLSPYFASMGLPFPVAPYIGIGVGYQWVNWSNNTFYTPTNSVNAHFASTEGAFAYQAILGTIFPIASVPGLALTLEYRFMGVLSRTYTGVETIAGPPTSFHVATLMTGQDFNQSVLVGFRYTFGVTPPPPPPAPAPVAAPAPAPARSYLVFFDWDKATLTDRAREIIREAATASTHVQYTQIIVNGYTDTSGTFRYNMGLSVRRARAVAAELVRDGVPENVISIHGYGETHLLVPTGPGVREPQNRRVEIIIR